MRRNQARLNYILLQGYWPNWGRHCDVEIFVTHPTPLEGEEGRPVFEVWGAWGRRLPQEFERLLIFFYHKRRKCFCTVPQGAREIELHSRYCAAFCHQPKCLGFCSECGFERVPLMLHNRKTLPAVMSTKNVMPWTVFPGVCAFVYRVAWDDFPRCLSALARESRHACLSICVMRPVSITTSPLDARERQLCANMRGRRPGYWSHELHTSTLLPTPPHRALNIRTDFLSLSLSFSSFFICRHIERRRPETDSKKSASHSGRPLLSNKKVEQKVCSRADLD